MNLISIQSKLQNLSDQDLVNSMKSADVPQFMVASEMQRRKEMRDAYTKQQGAETPQRTVYEELEGEMTGGLGSIPEPAYSGGGIVSDVPGYAMGGFINGDMDPWGEYMANLSPSQQKQWDPLASIIGDKIGVDNLGGYMTQFHLAPHSLIPKIGKLFADGGTVYGGIRYNADGSPYTWDSVTPSDPRYRMTREDIERREREIMTAPQVRLPSPPSTYPVGTSDFINQAPPDSVFQSAGDRARITPDTTEIPGRGRSGNAYTDALRRWSQDGRARDRNADTEYYNPAMPKVQFPFSQPVPGRTDYNPHPEDGATVDPSRRYRDNAPPEGWDRQGAVPPYSPPSAKGGYGPGWDVAQNKEAPPARRVPGSGSPPSRTVGGGGGGGYGGAGSGNGNGGGAVPGAGSYMDRYREYLKTVKGEGGSDEFAAIQEKARELYGDMSKRKDQAAGEGFLQAGLAIMASRAPTAMQAIGEGGTAGLQSYQRAVRELRDDQTKALSVETSIAAARAAERRGEGQIALGIMDMEGKDRRHAEEMATTLKAAGIRAGGGGGRGGIMDMWREYDAMTPEQQERFKKFSGITRGYEGRDTDKTQDNVTAEINERGGKWTEMYRNKYGRTPTPPELRSFVEDGMRTQGQR